MQQREIPRRRDAVLNREAILAAAVKVLQENAEASIDEIAVSAGLTRRAVYGHFSSRDELVESVYLAGAERISSALLPVDDSDPRLAIATIGARLWREVAPVRATARLAVRGGHRDRVAEALAPLRAVIERCVRAGIDGGQFRQDVAAPTLARLIEAAALAVLDEATRADLDVDEGERLVVISTLSCAGLGWQDAAGYVGAVIR